MCNGDGRWSKNVQTSFFLFAMASHTGSTLSAGELSASIALVAEGYSFPTNLDRDPHQGGLAPETQQALFERAIVEGMNEKIFASHLDRMKANQSAQ
jgi:hypothetical protein